MINWAKGYFFIQAIFWLMCFICPLFGILRILQDIASYTLNIFLASYVIDAFLAKK